MNTNTAGDLSVSAFLFKCQKNLVDVAIPFGVKRYDLLIYLDNKWNRVQIKTGRIKNGAVLFSTHSVVSRMHKKCLKKDYRGEIEFFGVYSPKLDTTYLVPVDEVGTDTGFLRFALAKNGQKGRIRLAKDFEF
jgi:hypothetical protein